MRIRAVRDRLGDVLLRAGIVDQEGINKALDRQRNSAGRLGSHLLQLGLISEDDLAKALSIQWGLPPFLPSLSAVDPRAVALLPRALAQRLRTVPFAWDIDRGVLQVALADPQNLSTLDEIRFATGARKVIAQVAPEAVIQRLVQRHYEGVEAEAPKIPEFSLTAGVPAAPSSPRTPSPSRSRGEAVLADPDPKRKRAMASLMEAGGFRVARLSSREELAAALGRESRGTFWVHDSWRDAVARERTDVRFYRDPIAALDDALWAGVALREEALALAEEAARLAMGDKAAEVRKAVSLLRFLGGRRGIEGTVSECLALRAWRAGLTGWPAGRQAAPLPGDDILEVVKAYERALEAGKRPSEAIEALRSDSTLDLEMVTSLIRIVAGEDFLSRFQTCPRLLVILPKDRSAAVTEQMVDAGWEVECREIQEAEDPADLSGFNAILADMGPGLLLLERATQTQTAKCPPVFLLTETAAAPDTMYALRLGAEDVLPFDTHRDVLETKLRRAANRVAPEGGSVRGSLAEMSLADTLQILSNGLKTAVIYLEGPDGAAQVALSNGQIVDARIGSFEGEEALYQLIRWDEGAFRIAPGEAPRATTVSGTTEGLLMEGFRRLDEERRDAAGSDEVPDF